MTCEHAKKGNDIFTDIVYCNRPYLKKVIPWYMHIFIYVCVCQHACSRYGKSCLAISACSVKLLLNLFVISITCFFFIVRTLAMDSNIVLPGNLLIRKLIPT